MWWFPWSKHDPSKDDCKTAKKISLHEEEDRRAREQMEIDEAKKESLKQAEKEEEMRRLEKSKGKGKTKQVEEDKGQVKPSKDHVEKEEDVNPLLRCNGCNSAIEDGTNVNAFGFLWHPRCLCCLRCHQPIAKNEISNSKGQYHRPCHRELFKCYVCKRKIPLDREGERSSREHPFWKEIYCPGHDDGRIAKCCSCERLESWGTTYVNLEDDRWLCRECMECAVMDTVECHHLQFEIREFFEGLNMKINQNFPILLVEKEALNKAEKKEKLGNHYGNFTRGICLSEVQMVKSVKKWQIGPNKQLIVDKDWKSQKVVSECEVTAILILYGLPRCMTGYLLAHEMMHAWLRLNGYKNLNIVLEEGLCQVLSHMWLEPQAYATPSVVARADASSTSRTPPARITSKKGDPSEYEKKLVEFCKYEIEEDETPVYGDGFRKVNKMMISNNYSLKDTLKEIVSISKTRPYSKV